MDFEKCPHCLFLLVTFLTYLSRLVSMKDAHAIWNTDKAVKEICNTLLVRCVCGGGLTQQDRVFPAPWRLLFLLLNRNIIYNVTAYMIRAFTLSLEYTSRSYIITFLL